MPKITIDQHQVEVTPGATILDAARKLGIDIPALCFLETCDPSTSCLCCLVKVNGSPRLVPACATAALDGMQVESETPDIHSVRRKSLELLLSDHLGDCVAPCSLACPAEMNIPQMLRQISCGNMTEAIATIKRDIALPAILGRICPAPCEKTCRRHDLDKSVSICLLKRYAADVDLASADPFNPPCHSSSGKKVAIIGAGPTGLASAYYLAQAGHICTIYDENNLPGGRLHTESTADVLPRHIIEKEIAQIVRLGVRLEMKRRIDSYESLHVLSTTYDAILLACGSTSIEQAVNWKLKTTPKGIEVAHTYQTLVPNIFAAGNAIRTKGLVVRSVADGKEAAASIDQFLSGQIVIGPQKTFTTKIGRMGKQELDRFSAGTTKTLRNDPAAGIQNGFTAEEAQTQATRCLHCDCRAQSDCKLRKYADLYGADPRRYKERPTTAHIASKQTSNSSDKSTQSSPIPNRREFEQDIYHEDIIFEIGKCIDCGLCIQIASKASESLGLTFIGRGFNVRVAVPLNRHLDEALRRSAAQCVAACPTAALAFKEKKKN